MTITCISKEISTHNALPPCFPSGSDDNKCYGSVVQTECGILNPGAFDPELGEIADFSGSSYILSEEDLFRYLCAKGVAELEIRSRTGVYDLAIDLIFGRENIERSIFRRHLRHSRANFKHFLNEGEYDGLDLVAIRNQARRYLESVSSYINAK